MDTVLIDRANNEEGRTYITQVSGFCLVLLLTLFISSQVQAAACTGGTAPAVEGTTLSDCYQRDFTVGGNNRTVRVWYTTDTTTYTVDSQNYVHGIAGQSQAEDVADAVQEAWEAVFAYSAIGGNTAHEPYITGCSSVLNIELRDGKGWAGIAYWGSSGHCRIGIDAPMISDGVGTGDDGVIFHEVQHYTQYSYNDGCYADFQPLYPTGNSWIESWANWAGKNATNATVDANYDVSSYNSNVSYYDLSYTNLHAGYLIQQYGGNGAPTDPEFGIKAVYEHYRKCDQYDDVFVMNETILALTGGAKNEKWAFVDFQAAYYAYPYADATTQPELIFPDADDKPTGRPAYAQDVTLSGGNQNWIETSPDTWTGRYFRIRPQAGCEFVELHVETQPLGGEIGINFLAADTGASTLQRSAHIGDSATRFFAGFPAKDELVVNVTSFDNVMTYSVTATCATPSLNIIKPIHNPGHAMVGNPSSPIAALTRFEVTSAGMPVSGVDPSTLSFDAEGDAPTLVAASFQEVGPGEYWGVIQPPVKPSGTTFVDYQVCLNTTICDSETDALLYVDPGNVDTVYVFDESGSMDTEDTPGEGRRIDNAKKAGKVLPDLLKDGDRIGIIGHGGLDNPAGCGLPGGAGNCANGNIVRLARINDVSVPADITTVKTAIDSVTDREVWTNTGQALIDAKDMLLANPGNTNPDHIILLSDGRENTHPLYDTPAVRGALTTAGVCVSTIGLGPEAPGNLLAQIAANHCGTYMPVPTTGLEPSRAALSSAPPTAFAMASLPKDWAAIIGTMGISSFYPAHLGIANANEYLDSTSQDSARLFHFLHRGVKTDSYSTHFAEIDPSVGSFQFMVAGKQPDGQGVRWVELMMPGMDPTTSPWIPISPPSGLTPADWDIRNDPYQDVVIVRNPAPGTWGFRVRYAEIPGDYIMNLSVASPVRLEGNLRNLRSGQGNAGDVVPILATLMDHQGLIPGAAVIAVIINEGRIDATLLLDDGNHQDGAANDGIYGFPYSRTSQGGSYAVRIVAQFPNPVDPAQLLFREWNGGFWIDGPQPDGQYDGDQDGDGMPDDWERRCKLIVGEDDSMLDKDRDGLPNIRELQVGTSPCQADTDRGGEIDGSEVNGGRNPLWAPDDKAFKVTGIALRALDKSIAIKWSQRPNTHTNVRVCVSQVAGDLGDCQDMGNEGKFVLEGLTNDQTYYLTLYGEGEDNAQGVTSDQFTVTPKEDSIPPQGAFYIGGPNVIQGGDVATSREVTLFIDATDTAIQYKGPAAGAGSPVASFVLVGANGGTPRASGNIEMRFSNSLSGIRTATWEPLAPTKAWTLDCADGSRCTVYGQFRDGAKNESLVVRQQILLKLEGVTGLSRAISLHAGIASPQGSLSSSHDDGYTFTLDYVQRISNQWAWDIRLGKSVLDGQGSSADIDIWLLGGNAKFTLNPSSPVQVFVNGGVNVYDIDPGSTEFGWNAGAGLAVPINPQLTIEGTFNYHQATTASPDVEFNQYQLGVLFHF